MSANGSAPQQFFLRCLSELTPDSIAVALAAITAGDIRAMMVDRAELAKLFGITPAAAGRFLKENHVPSVRLGRRGNVYVSKLALIEALHGRQMRELAPAARAVGLPPWAVPSDGLGSAT